jgi:hypothetical protein
MPPHIRKWDASALPDSHTKAEKIVTLGVERIAIGHEAVIL